MSVGNGSADYARAMFLGSISAITESLPRRERRGNLSFMILRPRRTQQRYARGASKAPRDTTVPVAYPTSCVQHVENVLTVLNLIAVLKDIYSKFSCGSDVL